MISREPIQRDVFGFKMAYHRNDGVWSDDFKELVRGRTPTIDEKALYSYLRHQYLVENRTLIQGIYKLPPTYEPNVIAGDVDDLGKAIEASVRNTIGTADKVGVFLSGGIDSSLVAALAVKYLGNDNVYAYCMAFDAFSELDKAQQVAKCLQIKLRVVPMSAMDVARVLPVCSRDFGEPMGDAGGINRWVLAREAAKDVGVVLTGDGGDEIFGGYPWYRLGLWIDSLGFKKRLLAACARLILHDGALSSPIGFLAHRAGVFGANDPQVYMEAAMSDDEVHWLLGIRLDSDDAFRRLDSDLGIVGKMQLLDIVNSLPEKYLVQAVGAYKNSGIIVCCPYIVRDVVDRSLGLPDEMRLHKGVGKYALRLVADAYLPVGTVWQKKHGFGTPLAAWFNGALGKVAVERLENGDLIKGYFKASSIKSLTGAIKRGAIKRYHDANAIWTILALQLWWDSINER